MKNIDFKRILNEFSDEKVTLLKRDIRFNSDTYMIQKAESIFFVKIFDPVDERLPVISVAQHVAELPAVFSSDESRLAIACNMINLAMDNGITATYVFKEGDESFITLKVLNPFLSDAFTSDNTNESTDFKIKMMLYTSVIAISNTRAILSGYLTTGDDENENS